MVLSSSRDDDVDDDVVSLPGLFFGNRSDGNFAYVGLKCLRLRLYVLLTVFVFVLSE